VVRGRCPEGRIARQERPPDEVRAGVVEAVVDTYSDGGSDMTLSKYAAIRREDGTVAGYGHTRRNGPVVHVGQRVARSQLIVHAGSSGTAGFPHRHVGALPTTVWRHVRRLAVGRPDSPCP